MQDQFNPYLIAVSDMPIERNPEPGKRFNVRVVRWYELELITSSNQGYIIRCDHRIETIKGRLMIRKPGEVVTGMSSYGCMTISFDSNYRETLASYYAHNHFEDATTALLKEVLKTRIAFLEGLPEAIDVMDYLEFLKLFESAKDCYIRKDEFYHIQIKSILYGLLDKIIKEQKINAHRTRNVGEQAIMSTILWMENNYGREISLQMMADKACYTRETYCRKFKQLTGRRPIEYLTNIRLSEARRKLLSSDLPIRAVANECGFVTDTYFYSLFKKAEGMTPSAYKNQHRIH